MTYEQALSILGLDQTSDASAVRRAYLRSVKAHSPERDPVGFQNVRAAYELVKEQSWRFCSFTAEPAEPSPAVVADATDPSAPPLGQAADDDPLAELRSRIESGAIDDALLADACERARSLDSAAAYELWLQCSDLLAYDEDSGSAREVVREAIARGHLGLVEHARARFPDLLTDAQLSDWLAEFAASSEAPATELSWALLRRQRLSEAVDVASLVLSRARSSFNPGTYDYFAVSFAFALFATGELPLALRFTRPLLAEGTPSGDPILTTALRELSDVADQLPAPVVIAIAEAMRAYDPADADLSLATYTNQHWLRSAEARRLLKRKAPTLFSLYGSALNPLWWRNINWRSMFGGWRLVILIQVVIGLARLASKSCTESEPTARSVPAVRFELHYSDPEHWLRCEPLNDPICVAAELTERSVECTERQHRSAELAQRLQSAKAQSRLVINGTDVLQTIEMRTASYCRGASK